MLSSVRVSVCATISQFSAGVKKGLLSPEIGKLLTSINLGDYVVLSGDLFGGNCEVAARIISWALCRIPVRPFDCIVKAGHRTAKELSHEKS
jgi:hypothetical protein